MKRMETTRKMTAQVMKRGMKYSATVALATLALALVPGSLQAKVIKVPSGAILTIQQGVDAAAPGDTVIVQPGTYGAGVETRQDKPGLKLRAVGPPGSVKIVGPGSGDGMGIQIQADNVLVEGFDISGFSVGIYGGLGVTTQGGQITRNTVQNCAYGCIVVTGSSNYEIDHNTVVGNPEVASKNGQTGIFVNGSEHHIHHNQVTDAEKDGIFVGSAPGSRLDHNVCDNNGEFGIYLAGSPNCTADHNQTDNNGPCPIAWGVFSAGIAVLHSPNCAVIGNEANHNGSFGIWVQTSCGTSFERNVAEGNGEGNSWEYDLFAPNWEESDPACNTYLNNRAGTASPSLELWDVKSSQ